jgi:uncharacterized protein YybS (DUF2232 family)
MFIYVLIKIEKLYLQKKILKDCTIVMHFLFYLLILKLGSKIKKWKNEKMKKLTGLETQQFLKIYIQIKSGLSKFKRKKKIKKKIILLIFFIYIHHYPKNIIISTIFNISESSVTNYFNFILEII